MESLFSAALAALGTLRHEMSTPLVNMLWGTELLTQKIDSGAPADWTPDQLASIKWLVTAMRESAERAYEALHVAGRLFPQEYQRSGRFGQFIASPEMIFSSLSKELAVRNVSLTMSSPNMDARLVYPH